nr:hypothetical protein GCM10020185_58920 [Pseudomonas brassicacearum subsp. brassicacearum]
MTDAIRYETGQDRIVVLTLDMPGQSANTMNAVYREAMAACVARLQAEKGLDCRCDHHFGQAHFLRRR